MKDLTITSKRIRLEILGLMICFFIAEGMNIYAIKKFNADWNELWTQLPFVLIMTAVFYAVFTGIRIFLKLVIMFLRVIRSTTATPPTDK